MQNCVIFSDLRSQVKALGDRVVRLSFEVDRLKQKLMAAYIIGGLSALVASISLTALFLVQLAGV